MLRHNVILMVYTLEHSDVIDVFLSLSYSRSLMEMASTFCKSSTDFVEIISGSSNLLKHLVIQ